MKIKESFEKELKRNLRDLYDIFTFLHMKIFKENCNLFLKMETFYVFLIFLKRNRSFF